MKVEKKEPSKAKTPSADARKLFGSTLTKARKDRGFTTAYAFFHKRGAKNGFGFSYKHYLMIESGQRLPSREGLARIIECISSDDGEGFRIRRELLVVFLKALVDGDTLFDPAFDAEPVTRDFALFGTDWRERMLNEAASIQVGAIPRMTVEQSEAFHSSKECFWVVTLLLRTGRPWSADLLAETLRLKPEKLAPALEHLTQVKLIARHASGGFFSPHAETDLWSGGMPNKMSEVAEQKFDWLNEKVKPEKEFYLHPYIVLPVSEAEKTERLRLLSELMRNAMRKAYLFNPRQPLEHGDLYLVQSRLVRLDVKF